MKFFRFLVYKKIILALFLPFLVFSGCQKKSLESKQEGSGIPAKLNPSLTSAYNAINAVQTLELGKASRKEKYISKEASYERNLKCANNQEFGFSHVQVSGDESGEFVILFNPGYYAEILREADREEWVVSKLVTDKTQSRRLSAENTGFLMRGLINNLGLPHQLEESLYKFKNSETIKMGGQELQKITLERNSETTPFDTKELICDPRNHFLPIAVNASADQDSFKYEAEIVYDTTAAKGVRLPLSMETNVINNRDKGTSTVEFDYSKIDEPFHHMCYLKHYGLPEPDKGTNRFITIGFLAFVIAIGAGFLLWRYKKN